jgi:hypothetical protein
VLRQEVARPHVVIYEVGISYHGRTYEERRKIGWCDGFRALAPGLGTRHIWKAPRRHEFRHDSVRLMRNRTRPDD